MSTATPAGAASADPTGALSAFADAVEERRLGVHAVGVAQHGQQLGALAWHPYRLETPHIMFSVSKSFTATAIGIARDEGLLDLDEPVADFFPAYATPEIVANLRGMRLRHVLAMATGHSTDTMRAMRRHQQGDWVRIFLEEPVVHEPGTRFFYDSGASYLLSAIVQARTGVRLGTYLRPRLFEPLGIAGPNWQRGPSGLELGASGLRLTVADLLAFGRLYLDRGVAPDGRRLLSEDWIDIAHAPHVANGDGGATGDWAHGYGFQFWRSRHGYRADGAYGQFALILPEVDAVVAITAGSSRTSEIVDAVWEHLLPALRHGMDRGFAPVGARTLPADGLRPGILADLVAPGEHLLPCNSLGVAGLRIEPDAIGLRLDHTRWEWHPLGTADAWGAESITAAWPHEEMTAVRMSARSGFLEDGRFRLIQQCIETPFARTWTFTRREGAVDIEVGLDLDFWRPHADLFTVPAR